MPIPAPRRPQTATLTNFFESGGDIAIIYSLSELGDLVHGYPSLFTPAAPRLAAAEAFEQSLPPTVTYGQAVGYSQNTWPFSPGQRMDSDSAGPGIWNITTPGTYNCTFSGPGGSGGLPIEMLLNGQPSGRTPRGRTMLGRFVYDPRGNFHARALRAERREPLLDCHRRIGRTFRSAAPQVGEVDLTGAYNREGIVTDGTTFSSSGFDGAGNALSANALGVTSGTAVTWNGNPYTIEDYNIDNVVSCDGQTIALPQASFSALSFLAAAASNQTDQIFTVTYSDGSTQQFVQNFSGWTTPQGYSGESVAATMTYRDTSGGTTTGTTDIYGYTFDLNPAKEVASITLPVDVNLNLIAADLVPSNVNLAAAYNREGIVSDGYASVVPTPLPSNGTFTNAGGVASGGYLQDPPGTSWGFTNEAGIMADNDTEFPHAEHVQRVRRLPEQQRLAGGTCTAARHTASGDLRPHLRVGGVRQRREPDPGERGQFERGRTTDPRQRHGVDDLYALFHEFDPGYPVYDLVHRLGQHKRRQQPRFHLQRDGYADVSRRRRLRRHGRRPVGQPAGPDGHVQRRAVQTRRDLCRQRGVLPGPDDCPARGQLLQPVAGGGGGRQPTEPDHLGVIRRHSRPGRRFRDFLRRRRDLGLRPHRIALDLRRLVRHRGQRRLGAPTAANGFACMLQEGGSISQSVNFATAGTYQISFQAAQRGGNPLNPIQFSVDGVNQGGTISPASSSVWTGCTTVLFTVTAGPHTIEFAGTNTSTDCTSFIDELSVDQTQQFTQSFSGWTTPQGYSGGTGPPEHGLPQ